ncbi:MAG TPA: hypothetical protein PL174_02475 [Fervidobacterium sp.]|nr:hypothetical protein [Fervidobacterium sp.]HPT58733.1 hypothetical protein [Fervidobacterium sp.]
MIKTKIKRQEEPKNDQKKTKRKIISISNYPIGVKPSDTMSLAIRKLSTYALLFAVGEFALFALLGLWDGVIGLAIGTVGMFLGITFIDKSYENYGIISLGKRRVPKLYFLRYLLYASLFLLSAIVTTEPALGIVGTFLGMINFKVVIFLFAWRWQ